MNEKKESSRKRALMNENNIKELRTQLGLTQDEFAESVEMSMSNIRAIENKERPLTIDNALKVCKKYEHVTLDYLFCRCEVSTTGVADVLYKLHEHINFTSFKGYPIKMEILFNRAVLEFFRKITDIETTTKDNDAILEFRESMIQQTISKFNFVIAECEDKVLLKCECSYADITGANVGVSHGNLS